MLLSAEAPSHASSRGAGDDQSPLSCGPAARRTAGRRRWLAGVLLRLLALLHRNLPPLLLLLSPQPEQQQLAAGRRSSISQRLLATQLAACQQKRIVIRLESSRAEECRNTASGKLLGRHSLAFLAALRAEWPALELLPASNCIF